MSSIPFDQTSEKENYNSPEGNFKYSKLKQKPLTPSNTTMKLELGTLLLVFREENTSFSSDEKDIFSKINAQLISEEISKRFRNLRLSDTGTYNGSNYNSIVSIWNLEASDSTYDFSFLFYIEDYILCKHFDEQILHLIQKTDMVFDSVDLFFYL